MPRDQSFSPQVKDPLRLVAKHSEKKKKKTNQTQNNQSNEAHIKINTSNHPQILTSTTQDLPFQNQREGMSYGVTSSNSKET